MRHGLHLNQKILKKKSITFVISTPDFSFQRGIYKNTIQYHAIPYNAPLPFYSSFKLYLCPSKFVKCQKSKQSAVCSAKWQLSLGETYAGCVIVVSPRKTLSHSLGLLQHHANIFLFASFCTADPFLSESCLPLVTFFPMSLALFHAKFTLSLF